MKNYLNQIHFLLILLTFICCQQKASDAGEADGLVKNYDADGRLIQEVTYKNGRINGLVKDYYKSGKVLQEVYYVNNIKHGLAKKYFEDGTLLRTTPYDSGKIHGVEIKYHSNGKLAFEAPYYRGEPCVGLKEYLPTGTLKTKYPSITITPVDNILREEKYILRVQLSDGSTAVKYYSGKLTDGKYIGKDAEQLWSVKKGVLMMEYYLPSGNFLMEQINIIAKMKTFQGNYYIMQRRYNVAAENRF